MGIQDSTRSYLYRFALFTLPRIIAAMPKPAARPVINRTKLLLSYNEWYCSSPSMISGSNKGKPDQNGIRNIGLYIIRIPDISPSQKAVHLAHNPDIPQGRVIHLEGIL